MNDHVIIQKLDRIIELIEAMTIIEVSRKPRPGGDGTLKSTGALETIKGWKAEQESKP